DNSKINKIETLLNLLSENNKFMGSLTIRKGDKILFNKAYGFSDILNNKKASTSTKYRIGSISKMFTSVMIFQLLETNKLKLETKLSEFFPEIPNAETITISNLLNHRSGIHSFTNDKDYLTWNTKAKSQSEMIKIISKGIPEFKPNEKADYSNSNYVLLGYIIEKLTKKDYSTNLKEMIIDKIGLKDTYYGGQVKIDSNESYSYNFENKKWVQEAVTDMSIPHGAGAIVSTPNDITLFITSLFNEKLVSKNSLNEMTTITDGYGKGIFEMFFYEHASFGHTGGIDAFHSILSYFPKDDLSIALTCNGLNYDMNNIGLGILSIYYNKDYEIPSFKKINIKPEIIKKYEGIY
ncbi:MAG: serine hydrolase domain-containing protein, partial [Candidatus Sericytochromatia bacterium]